MLKANADNFVSLKLNSLWLKAAVAGGLWASVEIIVGSFLHNLRVPFAGALLASFGVMLMVAFYRMWPERGLIWRAGLICALMKSISPSATLLGPMIGIFAESLVLESAIRLLGRSLPALLIGGGLAVSTAFAQKLFNILIVYGLNLVKIYLNLIDYVARQLGYQAANPWSLIVILFAVYFGLGLLAALTGFFIGSRTFRIESGSNPNTMLDQNKKFAESMPFARFSLWMLAFNILAIPAGIIIVNKLPFAISLATILTFVAVGLIYYPSLRRRITKPVLWLQLAIIVILAGVFFESQQNNSDFISMAGVWVGLEMCLRALLVISAFTGVSFELSNPKVRAFLFRQGMQQVYHAVSLAFKAMPAMLEAAPKPAVFFGRPLAAIAQMLAMAGKWQLALEKESQGTETNIPPV